MSDQFRKPDDFNKTEWRIEDNIYDEPRYLRIIKRFNRITLDINYIKGIYDFDSDSDRVEFYRELNELRNLFSGRYMESLGGKSERTFEEAYIDALVLLKIEIIYILFQNAENLAKKTNSTNLIFDDSISKFLESKSLEDLVAFVMFKYEYWKTVF